MQQQGASNISQQPERWVCPSDRQLALRAKLGTGWSFRSNQPYSSRKTDKISQEEMESIQNVVERAAKLMQVEYKRVGVLVTRLENLEDSAAGDGVSECRLCQSRFGLLGATKSICERCGKATCKKCGISFGTPADYSYLWVCKVCSEEREFWKRSGAWFYKAIPPFIRPGLDSTKLKTAAIREGVRNETAQANAAESATTSLPNAAATGTTAATASAAAATASTSTSTATVAVRSANPYQSKTFSRISRRQDTQGSSFSAQSDSDSDEEDASGRLIRRRRPVKIKQYTVDQPTPHRS